MRYVRQFGIILGVSFLGEVLKYLLPLPIPGSIYGLVIMLILLMSKILPLEMVKGAGNFLIDIMAIMFIPAGVGLLTSWNQVKGIWIQLVVIIVVTTVLVMAVTGRITQWVILHDENRKSTKTSKKGEKA